MKKMKKLFASLLVLCMLLCMPNMIGLAAEGDSAEEAIYTEYSGEKLHLSVDGGKAVYYQVYGVAGLELNVTGSGAYVIYNGKTYEAENGVVKVIMTEMGLRFPSVFAIGNSGTEAVTYEVDFVEPVGTWSNPEEITEDGSYTAKIAEGAESYYYTYTAPADGTVNVSISAYDGEWNTLGWLYSVNNMTTSVYGDEHHSDDAEVVNPESIEVKKGDVLEIIVNTYNPENMWGNPAGNVYTYVYFEYPEGTEQNPIAWNKTDSTEKVPAGTTYFVTGHSGATMIITAEGTYKVVMGDKEYSPVNGVVTIEIPKSESMWGPSATNFSIVNSGEAFDAVVKFEYPEGNENNPKEIEDGKYDAIFEEGDSEYYYEWTAPADGIVTVSISSEGGWQYVVNNTVACSYGNSHFSDDTILVPSEVLTVSKGDVLQIKVSTYNPEDWWTAPAGTVTTKVSFQAAAIVDGEVIASVKNEIANATEGSTEPIEIPVYDKETGKVTATVIPTDILAAVKDKDIWVSMNMNSYEWLINGKDITDTNPINLQVNIGTSDIAEDAIKNIANGNATVAFSIEHDGDFGFKASLVTVIDAAYAGKTANLYWNNNGTLEKVGTCVIDENGAVKFDFTHASDYVVVVEGTAVPNTGDFSSTLVYVVVLMGAALVAAGFVAKKRFA
ncbi:MAG: hypothetical protein ACI4TK_17525 [Agathobacter sp.]